jgi:hypothetical protein
MTKPSRMLATPPQSKKAVKKKAKKTPAKT